MAENSCREKIILANKTILEGVSGVKTVKRTLLSYSELEELSSVQFPAVVIVGRLPVPQEHMMGRDGKVDQINSELKIDVITYLQAYDDMDSEISKWGDTIFAALYQDQFRGGLVTQTKVKPQEKTNFWRPYVAFQMTVEHKYFHLTGGF